MLDEIEKSNIYGILTSSYKTNTLIPMASIALYFKKSGIEYKSKGYKKLKDLLLDLDYIEIKTNDEEGKHAEYVLIKEKKSDLSKISQKLYSDLLKKFKTNKSYPIASISLYLNKLKYDYSKYGFNKMKTFLSEFPFLEITTNKLQTNLIIKELNNKEVGKENNKDNNQKRLLKKEFVLSSHKKEGYFSLYISKAVSDCYKEIFNNNISDNVIHRKILNDLNISIKNNSLFKIDDAYAFYINNDENMIATMKKSTSHTSYDYYLNYIGQYKIKAKNEFKNDINFEDYEKAISELASIANKENWCYKNSKDKYVILKIYLQYTYHRLKKEKKILISNDKKYACFNTGLFTSNFEDIYCLLLINPKGSMYEYNFDSFSIAGIKGSGKTIVDKFLPLPSKASYITKPKDIYFDNKKEIHIDYQHIILENISRFPMTFLLKICKSFPKEYSLLKEIEKQISKPYSDALVDKLFYKFEENLNRNIELFNFIKASLEYAIKESIKRVNYDYHLVLPSYFPTRDVISLMLPISFDVNNVAQMFLLLEETESGNYQGQTIFTLKQCYANARLISPLNNTFLNPKEIND